jgi:hypothetical protein
LLGLLQTCECLHKLRNSAHRLYAPTPQRLNASTPQRPFSVTHGYNDRTTNMKLRMLFLFLLGILLAGCGGAGNDTVGSISGFVQDINGNPVRDARVFVDNGPETFSNSAGTYVLTDVHGELRTIKATVTQDGVAYFGSNVGQIFDGPNSSSVNITMVPNSQRATLRGTVRDRNGFLVEGAHVFAAVINGSGNVTVFSSTVAFTNNVGRFEINTLLGGQDYKIIASAREFNSDTEFVNISAGTSEDLDFTLANATDPVLPAPSINGIAWTTPGVPSIGSLDQHAGLEAVKRMIQPRRAQWNNGRYTTGGNFVEIDLDWTLIEDPSLIGYLIYRGNGDVPLNNLDAIDFYRDPMATLYEDFAETFQEFETYSYAMTSLNTLSHESNFSNRVVVNTLGDLNLDAVTFGPTTFHWQSGSGATSYTVFVFDRFPALGLNSIWSGTTASTQLAYGGPAVSGHRYYFVVLGTANGGSSKTLSFIDSFVAP